MQINPFSSSGEPVDQISVPEFSLIIVGDEILSGKRVDKHMSKVIELLSARGLMLSQVQVIGDSPKRITKALEQAFATPGVHFSCGGIGATPDDHTRQCAALALGRDLSLHPQAEVLIRERMKDIAKENNTQYIPDHPDNIHRLNMGVFPLGSELIHNPYNKIPGFTCLGEHGVVHFVPGFPVMAWPMIESILDTKYAQFHQMNKTTEMSMILYGSMEAALTPYMQQIEESFPGIKVFSLPSVDHPVHGKHIELGVKGASPLVEQAYQSLKQSMIEFGAKMGPEVVR
jgi:molybdopterin-biosynthesis enzyme MoeA-like protein